MKNALFLDIYRRITKSYLLVWIASCVILFSITKILLMIHPPKGKDLTLAMYMTFAIISFFVEICCIALLQSLIFWIISKYNSFFSRHQNMKNYMLIAILYNMFMIVIIPNIPENYIHSIMDLIFITTTLSLITSYVLFLSYLIVTYLISKKKLVNNHTLK